MGIFAEAARKDKLHLVLLVFPIVLTALVWDRLPDRSPFRSPVEIQVDEPAPVMGGYALIFMPLVNIAVWAFLVALPHLDRRRSYYLQYPRAYSAVRFSIILFLAVLNLAALFKSIGYAISMPTVILYTILFLLIIPGSGIRHLAYDHPFGIRTRRALASQETWRNVHLFTARLWTGLAAGFSIGAILVDATIHMYLVPVVFAAAAGTPIVYSYVIDRGRGTE